MTVDTDVLIVGAGPTGLALGIDLARRGVAALVVERADRLFPGSRGKGIQPRTMEVFDDLGVLDAIRAAGGDYPVGMIWRDGERVGEHRMFDPAEEIAATTRRTRSRGWCRSGVRRRSFSRGWRSSEGGSSSGGRSSVSRRTRTV